MIVAHEYLDRAPKIGRLASLAGVVQWQNGSFPSCIRGFDSLRPLQILRMITVDCRFAARWRPAGGLFIPLEAGIRPGNFIRLPNQAVDNNGNITVPYAGTRDRPLGGVSKEWP